MFKDDIADMKTKPFVKLISIIFVLVMLAGALTSCGSPVKAKTVVGKVGEFEVRYEELYFLSVNYAQILDARYGEYSTLDEQARAAYDAELCELVYENVVTNHAILTLCKKYGLTLDSEGLDERVDKYVENMIATEFGGSRSDYKNSLSEYGMTENYVEFTAAVDLLYSDLLTKLLEDGTIPNGDDEVISIINEDFICTWHIMVANDEGDDIAENRALIEEALKKYNDGKMSMFELIGSKYNEDLSVPFEGNYIARGHADKEYENAAFALEVGEISGVVESRGVTANGDRVSCFYLIKRLPIDMDYVKANLYELKEIYYDGVMASMLDEVRATLSFEPNEYCKSLTLTSLDEPRTLNTAVIVIAAVTSVAAVASVVIIVVRKKKKALKK